MREKSLFQCGAIGVEGFSLLIPLKKHLASDHKENEISYNRCCKTVVIKINIQIVHEGIRLFPNVKYLTEVEAKPVPASIQSFCQHGTLMCSLQ